MDLTVTLGLYAATVFVAGALGFTIGRSVGHKDGFDQGMRQAEVSVNISPYTRIEPERAEVGFTLQLMCNGRPVLEPIDVLTREPVTGKRLDRDKEKVAVLRSDALGAASTKVAAANAGGVRAILVTK